MEVTERMIDNACHVAPTLDRDAVRNIVHAALHVNTATEGLDSKQNRLHRILVRLFGESCFIWILSDKLLYPEFGFGAFTVLVKRENEWRLITLERLAWVWIFSRDWEISEEEARHWLGEEAFPPVQMRNT